MKIAIITGASSGMGREFAYRLSEENEIDEIWLIARRVDRLQDVASELSKPCKILAYDLSDTKGACEKLNCELKVDNADVRYLVNSAGYGLIGEFTDFDGVMQSGVVNVNCTALTAVTGVILPYMCEGAKIINMASASAFLPQPGFAVYAASKSYVLSFSRALRHELRERKINVLAVCPGPVDTEFFETAQDRRPIKPYKKFFMIKSDFVVKGALKASRRNKSKYIPTVRMKLFEFAMKVLPHGLIVKMIG